MIRASRAGLALHNLIVALLLVARVSVAFAQDQDNEGAIVPTRETAPPAPKAAPAALTFTAYTDPVQGVSSLDIVRRALDSNQELAAGRLDVDRGRGRLRQAGLRPNPTLDFEQTTGRLAGSPGEWETTIGVAVPLEVGGQRGRRVALAEVELAALEAEVADRERRLRSEVLQSAIGDPPTAPTTDERGMTP